MAQKTDITLCTTTKSGPVLNLEHDCTYYLHTLGNLLSQQSSKIYREKYGLGVVEWRCLVMFGIETTVSAARICEMSNMNKSIVSRSLKNLEALGYVTDRKSDKIKKPRLLQMTVSGRHLHDEMLKIAIDHEKRLRARLSHDEIAEFLRVIKIMRENADTPS